MGKVQWVSLAYMEIREGEPCPTTAMNVGVGRARSSSGVTESVRVRRYSWQFYWASVSILFLKVREESEHTPQKKCRMNIISTRRVTFGPEYRFLNGTILPSLSNTVISSTLFRTACVGISLFVFTSPVNSTAVSMLYAFADEPDVSIEVFGIVIVAVST